MEYIPIIKITDHDGMSRLTKTNEEAEEIAKNICNTEMVLDCFLAGIDVVKDGQTYTLTNPDIENL